MTIVNKIGEHLASLKTKLTKKNNEGRLAVFDSVIFNIICSLLIVFLVEILARQSFTDALRFLILKPYAFVFNATIVYLTLSVSFLVPKRIFVFILVAVIWIGLGIADFVLLMNRTTPLNAVDFTLITSVFRIFGIYLEVYESVLIIFVSVVVLFLLVFAAVKLKSYKVLWKKGIVSIACTAVFLVIAYSFGIWSTSLSDKFTNMNTAYSDYGFVYCFTAGIFDRGINKPSDYKKEKINEILSGIDEEDKVPAVKPNIIFVQLESFFDVNYINYLEYSENPVSYFEELKKKGLSGKLTVPVVGSGTINTEFEVLTGMDLSYFGAGEYPYKTVLSTTACESIAYNLSELGYSTHAIHNYEGTFYNRDKVYPYLGFDSFTPIEMMTSFDYNESGIWPDDSVLTSEIINTMKSTEGSDFVMAISVQGHGKYPPENLPEDYNERITVSYVDGYEGSPDKLAGLSYYINQIEEMDEFLEELVYAVKKYDENTVLVLYGDHLPSFSITDEELSEGNIFTTEYVMISNYNFESKNGQIGDIESFRLSAEVLDCVGINNGLFTKLHQKYSKSDLYADWLYNLQYDILYGKRYAYGEVEEYYKPVDMRIGTKDITIDSYRYDGKSIYIYGKNFTKFSCAEINGTVYKDTLYISEGQLVISFSKAIETLAVDQYTATKDILYRVVYKEKEG